jgi:hypothetical protein
MVFTTSPEGGIVVFLDPISWHRNLIGAAVVSQSIFPPKSLYAMIKQFIPAKIRFIVA